ncbi:filamentous hemagglutinin N-terminal domain-containing protein [Scytonema sp. UIC 10036]|uniref:beta strand repeat-containing protein n=1 Tax=Scytonema sp. UIC 10036 TaxID=2304196 RepID=UPI0012DAE27A|nr:S-layer family protein [Scytonema sp. UIC 10036]MUG95975.1 filamentous hemagglutinin N-terminal domain-containing protein [Scytonema sp. UIC 10036]
MFLQNLLYQWWRLELAGLLVFVGAIASANNCALAQIVPDNTLGDKNSVILSSPRSPIDRIEGGLQQGANLFHSFEKFNVSAQQRAFFINPPGIKNIISRVTGSSRSEILGTLGVLGTANLFFLNPNGIVFGPNAQLNIAGSFVATTANAIKFGDRGFWSASTPNSPTLLTVNPTAFLFNQIASQPIINQSTLGLRLPANQSLLLVGGDISLQGGRLLVPGGRIELGGLAGSGTVALSMNENSLNLTFPQNEQQALVSLTDGATVDVNYQQGSGNIQISGRRVTFTDGSKVVADTRGLKPGTLTVTASESVEVIGSSLLAENYSTNAGGDLIIETGKLIVRDGALIAAGAFNNGQAGSVTVRASDFVELSGTSADGQNPSSIITQTDGAGNAGSVKIETGKLIVRGGARISTSTTSSGQGGTLLVKASDSVELIGTSTPVGGTKPSGLFALSQSSGKPGDLTIETKQLTVRDGARITASNVGEAPLGGTLTVNATDSVQLIGTSADGFRSSLLVGTAGVGSAGELTVRTQKFQVLDGAIVSARTDGKGQGGSIVVNASNFTEIAGFSPDGKPSVLTTETTGVGDGGNLIVETGQLTVKDGAEITSSSTGGGRAGDVKVLAGSLRLNRGYITSQTTSGNGGDITLSITDLLLMRYGSQISSSAGTAQAGGDGGNITINSPFIIGVLHEDSNISANAFTGSGGRVDITTKGIFGIQPQLRETVRSDITASSEFGINGEVIVRELDVDPNNALVELPANPIDASGQIATDCNSNSNSVSSSFTTIGRGGVAQSPIEPLMNDAVLAQWVVLPSEIGSLKGGELKSWSTTTPSQPTQIVEASNWVVDAQGDLVLVATASTAHNSSFIPVSCPR